MERLPNDATMEVSGRFVCLLLVVGPGTVGEGVEAGAEALEAEVQDS